MQLIREGRKLVEYITRARVPMPKSASPVRRRRVNFQSTKFRLNQQTGHQFERDNCIAWTEKLAAMPDSRTHRLHTVLMPRHANEFC